MNLKFVDTKYQGAHACVKWHGFSLCDGAELSAFLSKDVIDRLYDTLERDESHSLLRSLPTTGMGKDCIEEILNAEIPEERGWAIGEALAEALLIHSHKIVFPWNMHRDMRNARSSLAGADIIGFLPLDSGFKLVLGEIKTSSEEKYPPQVMSGRHIGHQIENLAYNRSTIYQLLRWLHSRTKNTKYQEAYEHSVSLYCDSGNKAVSLFGILIRDTLPNELDLQGRGRNIGSRLEDPASCELIAFYLPFKIADLPNHIHKRDAS